MTNENRKKQQIFYKQIHGQQHAEKTNFNTAFYSITSSRCVYNEMQVALYPEV